MKAKFLLLIIILFGIYLITPITWSAAPAATTVKGGYLIFKDSPQDVIHSDGNGFYQDCSLGGTDMIQVKINSSNGSLNALEIYIGVMYKKFFKCDQAQWSPRRLTFHFNVSGITDQPTHNAVVDILRWYQYPHERCVSNPGYILDASLHVPMTLNVRWITGAGSNLVEFAIDPLPDINNPGTDIRAVTQDRVNDYYTDDTDITYFCTRAEPEYEPAPYLVYFIDLSDYGYNVQPIAWNKSKKPITWIIKTNPVVARLFVLKDDTREKIYLTDYGTLPYEFAVSLNPFPNNQYPVVNLAPASCNSAATTWGELKGD